MHIKMTDISPFHWLCAGPLGSLSVQQVSVHSLFTACSALSACETQWSLLAITPVPDSASVPYQDQEAGIAGHVFCLFFLPCIPDNFSSLISALFGHFTRNNNSHSCLRVSPCLERGKCKHEAFLPSSPVQHS